LLFNSIDKLAVNCSNGHSSGRNFGKVFKPVCEAGIRELPLSQEEESLKNAKSRNS